MIYITGDKHGDYTDVFNLYNKYNTSKNDILIILGDAGINYFSDKRDYILKDSLKELPITFFALMEIMKKGLKILIATRLKDFIMDEEEYPNILFANDAGIYDFDGNNVLVIGGAYSVDKEYRLMMEYNWYPSEAKRRSKKQG